MADQTPPDVTPSGEIACPVCATRNPAGFRFCGACGSPLERTCRVCGSNVPAGFRFCGVCGNDLAAEASRGERGAEASATGAPPADPAQPLPERKVVTALFADLTESTQLASRLDPEDLRAILSPFFEAMAEEIDRFGGTVEKYIGDAIVAVFGVPVAHEDDPERAVAAALAMQRRLTRLNRELAGAHGTELAMRIGINTGEVVTVTGVDREGLVTGEAVNIAARFQALAEPGGIVVGDRTRRDARERFTFRPLGEVRVKGIDRALAAWAVEADRPAAEGARGRVASPMVGRDSELELLRLLLARTTRERRANLATLIGPAGIGKSRLAHEFAALTQVEDPAPVLVRGRCLPYGEGLTYWPLAEILKADAGILDSDDPRMILEKATRRLEERLPGEGRGEGIANVLLSSIGMSAGADPLTGADAETAKQTIARSWRAYFESLATESPVVALVEDLHWADPSLLDLVESLAAKLTAPVLFLCTARPDLAERRATWAGGLRNATAIELSPLSGDDAAALVGHLLGPGGAPQQVLEAVLERAEGNPFFAGELVRMLVEDRYLVRDGDRWRLDRPIAAALPDTVQGVIASRIDLLPPQEKRAIQDAAVVGRIFWQGALRRLGSAEAAAVDGLLDKGLVMERETSSIEGERELIFNHVLTRDVAYASIPRARRPAAHAEAGAWIEEVTRGRVEEFAEILAFHFEQAGDVARTARYALAAGHRRRRVFAAGDAIRWYTRVIDAEGEPDPGLVAEAFLYRGAAHEVLAAFPEAHADYDRAIESARSAGAGMLEAQALAALAHVLWLEDRYEEGREILSRGLDRIREVGAPELEARLLYTAGTIAFARTEYDEAERLHRRCVEVAARSGDLEGKALGLHGLCETHWFTGPVSMALEEGLQADAILRAQRSRLMIVHNGYMVAWAYAMTARLGEARRILEEIIGIGEELGARRDLGFSYQALGHIAFVEGRLEEALGLGRRAIQVASEVASPRLELAVLGWHVQTLIALGHEDTEAAIERLHELDSTLGAAFFHHPAVAWRGYLAALRGDATTARALHAEAIESPPSPLHSAVVWYVAVLTAEELWDVDLVEAAGAALTEPSVDRVPYAAWGWYAAALADLLRGRPEDAIERAAAAVEFARTAGERNAEWRALHVLAAALRGTGRDAEADGSESEAASAFARVADAIRDPALRESFLRRPAATRLLSAGRVAG